MISEMQLPYHGSVHLKDEAKLAIIRDYVENNMSAEEVVLKYHLNNKYLFYPMFDHPNQHKTNTEQKIMLISKAKLTFYTRK
jgi:hypothetical protein